MRRIGSLLVVPLVVVLSATGSLTPAEAQKGGPLAKLTDDLVVLQSEYAVLVSAVGQAQANALFRPSSPLLRVAAGLVVIDAVADGDAAALLADLEALGLQNGKAFGRMVSGRFPIGALRAMAALPSLRLARPAYATTNIGLTTSQADPAMRADIARATFGVNGTGVLVGTLSDSFNCLGGAAGDVASGDLPAGIVVLEELAGCTGATDEGRAMMQLIRDVAPGASQAFHTAFGGQASFAQGIIDLANAGAQVIVDDVIYLFEPMFQDGIVAQAVNTVTSMGVAYFSSAGNLARDSYESAFNPGSPFAPGAFPSVPGAPPFSGGQAHDFDPGAGVDHFQQITLPANSAVSFSFQWDQPFFSVSGGAGSSSDYDIYLLNNPPTTVLAGSITNNVGGDPVEVFGLTNTGGSPVTVNLMLVRFAGANAGKLKYVASNRNITINEFATNSSTLFGHANATGATAVGAAFFAQTPAFGQTPPLIESFSSAGGTLILFQVNGTPTSETRLKPEIVAPDGTNTTFFGADSPSDPDAFPNFSGTSAAAPHAAAVAALIRQLRPGISPTAIRSVLQNTAIDMGPAGFDFDSGLGLIQADAALAAVSSLGAAIIVTGADAGGGPHVKAFDAATGAEIASFLAFAAGFTGGVRVATGDVSGGVDDIITAAGPGGGPHVRVFDGQTGAEIRSFFAYSPSFTGGVFVAAGDVNGDGIDDIITGAGPGGGPHVRVFDGVTLAEIRSFFAYSPSFTGGVRVAAGDVNGDGQADVITGAGPGGGPHVLVFDGVTLAEIRSFFAYSPSFTGGVFVGGN